IGERHAVVRIFGIELYRLLQVFVRQLELPRCHVDGAHAAVRVVALGIELEAQARLVSSRVKSVLLQQQKGEQRVGRGQVRVDAEHLLQDLDGADRVALSQVAAGALHERLDMTVGDVAHSKNALQTPKASASCGRRKASATTTNR